MKIPISTINDVISKVDLVDLIRSKHVELKKRGNVFEGLCPFHDENTPSFKVSPSKKIFKCFGCGIGGDASSFLQKYDQLSFPESIELLAERVGIDLEIPTDNSADQHHTINKEIVDLLNFNFNTSQISFLKKTRITKKILKEFDVGVINISEIEKLKSKYPHELLKEIGIINDNLNSWLLNKVLFPIRSYTGNVIGFGGRDSSYVKGNKSPKYTNSKESIVYNKSMLLYGLYKAKKIILKKNNCYLVEGYTDLLTMHQLGYTNSVAISGSAFTKQQARLLKNLTSKITLVLDGDEAGLKATYKAIHIALHNNLFCDVVLLPKGADPNSLDHTLLHESLKVTINSLFFLLKDLSSEEKFKEIKEIKKSLKGANKLFADLIAIDFQKINGIELIHEAKPKLNLTPPIQENIYILIKAAYYIDKYKEYLDILHPILNQEDVKILESIDIREAKALIAFASNIEEKLHLFILRKHRKTLQGKKDIPFELKSELYNKFLEDENNLLLKINTYTWN